MKLLSVHPYPVNVSANGFPTNLVRNKTPSGAWQIARVLIPGGPAENDFELLYEGSQQDCEEFLQSKVEEELPGLMEQR